MEECLTCRGKTHKKNLGGTKLGPKLGFWPFFKFVSLVFLDIEQDCSLGQCLTSSRAEISKESFVAQIRT